jgi:hypothetical protein
MTVSVCKWTGTALASHLSWGCASSLLLSQLTNGFIHVRSRAWIFFAHA